MTFVERCQAFAAKHHKISPFMMYVTLFVTLSFIYPSLIYAAEVTTSPHTATSTEFSRPPLPRPQAILFGTGTPRERDDLIRPRDASSTEERERPRLFTSSNTSSLKAFTVLSQKEKQAQIKKLKEAILQMEKSLKEMRVQLQRMQRLRPASSTQQVDVEKVNSFLKSLKNSEYLLPKYSQ